jgi:Gluconate 2-dehydrogenase subunit 3
MDRRKFLVRAGVGAAALASAGAIWALLRQGQRGNFSEAKRALLSRVADLTIPAGETLGALGAEAPVWVELAITRGVGGVDVSIVERLDQELGGAFMSLDAEAQVAALRSLDQQAFAAGAASGEAWRAVKALIAAGYYTSEIGAAQELQYELVPGRFDPDLPAPANARAWSSDWTAWDFG